MASKKPRSNKSRSKAEFLQKPRGIVHPRVQAAGGPQFFGIVSIDCAKARSKWMLADFYGNVLVPPTEVAHNRVELELAVRQVREALAKSGLKDCLVAVQRTGRYHHPIKNAFRAADLETRLGPSIQPDPGIITVWDAATGKEKATLKGPTRKVNGLAVSPEGKFAAMGGGFINQLGEVKIFDLTTGNEIAAFHEDKEWVGCVTFSSDGRWLVSGSGWTRDQPGELRIWDMKTLRGKGE